MHVAGVGALSAIDERSACAVTMTMLAAQPGLPLAAHSWQAPGGGLVSPVTQNVELPDIKTLGTYDATVKLHPEVGEPKPVSATCLSCSCIRCCCAHALLHVFAVHKGSFCQSGQCIHMRRHCRQVIGKFKIVVQKLKEQGK